MKPKPELYADMSEQWRSGYVAGYEFERKRKSVTDSPPDYLSMIADYRSGFMHGESEAGMDELICLLAQRGK